jgi:hypothetical protein
MPTKQEKDIKSLKCLLSWDFNYSFNSLVPCGEEYSTHITDISRKKEDYKVCKREANL